MGFDFSSIGNLVGGLFGSNSAPSISPGNAISSVVNTLSNPVNTVVDAIQEHANLPEGINQIVDTIQNPTELVTDVISGVGDATGIDLISNYADDIASLALGDTSPLTNAIVGNLTSSAVEGVSPISGLPQDGVLEAFGITDFPKVTLPTGGPRVGSSSSIRRMLDASALKGINLSDVGNSALNQLAQIANPLVNSVTSKGPDYLASLRDKMGQISSLQSAVGAGPVIPMANSVPQSSFAPNPGNIASIFKQINRREYGTTSTEEDDGEERRPRRRKKLSWRDSRNASDGKSRRSLR